MALTAIVAMLFGIIRSLGVKPERALVLLAVVALAIAAAVGLVWVIAASAGRDAE
jgi:hypothetical protein